MTAREHCAARRALPFGAYRRPTSGEPTWKKLGHGYIAVTDGTEKAYVAPGLIFAVEIHDNSPAIYAYTRDVKTRGLEALKPYAARTLYHMLARPEGWIKTRISYDYMISCVRSLYPDIMTPDAKIFCREYGILVDADGVAKNYLNLDNDDC